MSSQRQSVEPAGAALRPTLARTRSLATLIVRGLRRGVGLHGDAVGNAAGAVRRDDHARSNRNHVAEHLRMVDDPYPTQSSATEPDASDAREVSL